MKIIGKTKDGYVLTADADEVANLLGYYSRYSKDNTFSRLEIGDDIQINLMYQQLRSLSSDESVLNKTKEHLSEAIKHLELVNPLKIEIPEG